VTVFYGFDGSPITLEEWVELFDDPVRLCLQEQVGRYFISTVWLGIDHNFYRYLCENETEIDQRPWIFETMVVDEEGGVVDQWREATYDEAMKRHVEVRLGLRNDSKQKEADGA
jgi:hypothetical protein